MPLNIILGYNKAVLIQFVDWVWNNRETMLNVVVIKWAIFSMLSFSRLLWIVISHDVNFFTGGVKFYIITSEKMSQMFWLAS